MAARSNMVLMDLFAVCEGNRGDREMVCHCKSVNDILSPLCHHSLWLGLTHMRPTLCNSIMIPTLCIRDDTCHDGALTHDISGLHFHILQFPERVSLDINLFLSLNFCFL